MINQQLFPHKFEIVEYYAYRDVANAITTVVTRGVPSIGATGAYSMALASVQDIDLEYAGITNYNQSSSKDRLVW